MDFFVGQVFTGTYPPEAAAWCMSHEATIKDLAPDGASRKFQIISLDSLKADPAYAGVLAKAEAEAILTAHMRAAILQTAAFTQAEFTTLAAASCFESWQAGTSYTAGQRIEHNGVVYEVMQDVTAIENQPPDTAGMLAVYRPLSVDPSTGEEPDGTKENPYAYIEGMDVHEGSYYSYEGELWLAKADMLPCIWAPGTEGLWQWEKVTL